MSERAKKKRRVMVVTGSRAEFGLLHPVMEAIEKNKRLELRVVVAGEHLLGPAQTWKEVAKAFRVDAKVAMQRTGDRGRVEHAAACARGMVGFAAAIKRIKPEWVVVLGDRIEAFAAASAASIGGVAVCHIHGGDRAEGIADEAMRHAITKLAHLHCAATKGSAERIVRMGERKESVFVTGSPAIDGLRGVRPMSDREALRYGDPRCVVLLHPSGLSAKEENVWASEAAICAREIGNPGRSFDRRASYNRVLLLAPNRDPGREEIVACWQYYQSQGAHVESHLPRPVFLSLLARLRQTKGCLIGNSSAGLIEAAALRVAVLNLGPRQSGREHGRNVVDSSKVVWPDAAIALQRCRRLMQRGVVSQHPYGDGRTGPRIAALLAKVDPHDGAVLRKRNSY